MLIAAVVLCLIVGDAVLYLLLARKVRLEADRAVAIIRTDLAVAIAQDAAGRVAPAPDDDPPRLTVVR